MTAENTARIAALLTVSETPLTLAQLQRFAELERDAVEAGLARLETMLPLVGMRLAKVAEGWRIEAHPDQAPWIKNLLQLKAPKLSRAQLETLAIIAHRQPITRAEIEQIRGVSLSSGVLQALQGYGWVTTRGHKDVPGKPALWVTTKQLLMDLGLENLASLQNKLDEIIRQTQLDMEHET